MKKYLVLIGLVSLSMSSLASMEVENFGMDGLELKANGKFIKLNNSDRKYRAEKILTLEALNGNKIPSLVNIDPDLEEKIIPYINYLAVNNIENYGGGIGFFKKWDEDYLFGVGGEMYQTSYDNWNGYKGLMDLYLGYQDDENIFVLTPFYYFLKNSEKINEKNIGVVGYLGQSIETEFIENLSYEINMLGLKNYESKNEKEKLFRAGIALKHTDEIELNSLNIKIKEKILYQYNFKDEAMIDSSKDKIGLGLGAEITKTNIIFSLENEFKKSLSNKNYENSTSFTITYKF